MRVVVAGGHGQIGLRLLRLLADGKVQTRPLISHTFPLSEWRQAFDLFEQRSGVKMVLLPDAS